MQRAANECKISPTLSANFVMEIYPIVTDVFSLIAERMGPPWVSSPQELFLLRTYLSPCPTVTAALRPSEEMARHRIVIGMGIPSIVPVRWPERNHWSRYQGNANRARIVRPLLAKCALIALKMRWVSLCCSSRRRNSSQIIASGAICRSDRCRRSHEWSGCRRSRPPHPRTTNRSNAGRYTCAACVPVRYVGDRIDHHSGSKT